MPLSKARMKERKRLDRALKATNISLLVKPASNPNPVKPVKPELAALRAIMDDIKSKPAVPPTFIPRYQMGVSKTGDRVRMPDGSIVTVPELDGDGNTLWQ